MSSIIKKYISPDDELTFKVIFDGEDITLGFEKTGFEGFGCHTHGDILASENNKTPKEAANLFIDDLLSDRILIVIRHKENEKEVLFTCTPENELKYKQKDEELEFRFWSGSKIHKNQEILTNNVQWKYFP
ncbi:MAG: hypothetical protein ABL857_04105 [Rickettsiales bacterium]